MSMFIMKKESIAAIAYYMADKLNNSMDFMMGKSMIDNLKEGDVWDFDVNRFDSELLFDELYLWNYRSRKVRYGDDFEFGEWGEIPDQRTLKPISEVQIKKSLDCYLYQCCEGDIPEKRFYLGVVDFRNRLANKIVNGLAEYDDAEWD